MCTDADGHPSSDGKVADPVAGNQPWVDPYTDDVLAKMRAQGPLSAIADKVRDAAGSAFIGSSIDTDSNSVTVHWHRPRRAVVDSIVGEASALGITVHIVDAPFSAAVLSVSRSRITERMQELGISRVGFDGDGRGSTVHFRTAAELHAAKEALADYEQRVQQDTDDAGDPPAIAALHSPPGSPAVRISDQLSNPQPWTR